MSDNVELAKELIDVLDYISNKLGVTIDWGSNNLVPYLKTLGEHIVNYKLNIAYLWMIVAIVTAIFGAILFVVSAAKSWDEATFIACIMIIAAIIIAIVNGYTIVACKTFPEKVILDFIESCKDSMSRIN